jgi:cell division transport system permease protein
MTRIIRPKQLEKSKPKTASKGVKENPALVKRGLPTRKKPKSRLRPILQLPTKVSSIVPRENIASNALTLVIGIMTFLVCVTFGAVTLISDTAVSWQNDIAREVTIQIRPLDGVDMNEALVKAKKIADQSKGIAEVTILDEEATARLLEPWLGTGLNLEDLPVPRLISVRLEAGERPDFAELRRQLKAQVPGASLDDHQVWADRLTTMAGATVFIGMAIMVLVMSATVLTVVFATRGAMSSNRHIIEILHFVGAKEGYIASQFQRHFLLLGLKGGAIGGLAAILVFLLIGYWTAQNIATPGNDQVVALFGTFSVGLTGYGGSVIIVILISFLTAITSRATVFRHISALDRNAT